MKKTIVKKDGFKVKIAGVGLNSSSQKEVLRKIDQRIQAGKRTFITTPNSEFLVFAQKNPWFRQILNQADLAVPDTIGLVWAGIILGKPVKRFPGVHLMEALCRAAAKSGWTVYLLGARPGVAQKTLAVLKKRYPGLKGWAEEGPPDPRYSPKTANKEDWVGKINQKKPDLLFVAFGMGKQEKFIADNWSQLRVKLAMGVGGAFDYLSGRVKWAPKWVRKLGFEWIYRLFQEPWRWRRQLRLIEFIVLVIRERFKR